MEKERCNVRQAAMGSFVLCPFLIVVKDETKQSGVNIITISYASVVSESPPIIGLAIRSSRYSYGLIEKHQELTLNLPTIEMLSDVDFCGSRSGRKFDKAMECKIDLEPSENISTPRIKKCPINLECEVREFFHLQASHEFIMVNVVAFHRAKGFQLEKNQMIVTTNFDYRSTGECLGKAFKVWDRRKKRR